MNLKIGRRTRAVGCRLLVQHRARPDVVAPLLTAGASLLVVRGYALVSICYTRLGGAATRWLPKPLTGSAHQLEYRCAVESEDGALRCSQEVLHDESPPRFGGGSVFTLTDRDGAIALRVRSGDRDELIVRARTAPGLSGSVFASPREAGEYLVAPDRPNGEWALEPLAVSELQSAFLAATFPPGALELDSAFRLVSRRMQPVAEAMAKLRPSFESGSSATALPSS